MHLVDIEAVRIVSYVHPRRFGVAENSAHNEVCFIAQEYLSVVAARVDKFAGFSGHASIIGQAAGVFQCGGSALPNLPRGLIAVPEFVELFVLSVGVHAAPEPAVYKVPELTIGGQFL